MFQLLGLIYVYQKYAFCFSTGGEFHYSMFFKFVFIGYLFSGLRWYSGYCQIIELFIWTVTTKFLLTKSRT